MLAQFTFEPDNGDPIGAAVRGARDFAQTHQLDPTNAARLAILVEELVANICEHGSSDGLATIELDLSIQTDAIGIVIRDSGASFNPDSGVSFDGPNMVRGGGAGLELVRTWSKIVSYHSINGHNTLTLRMPISA